MLLVGVSDGDGEGCLSSQTGCRLEGTGLCRARDYSTCIYAWDRTASCCPVGILKMKNTCRSTGFWRSVACALVLLSGAGLGVAQDASRKIIKRVEAQYPAVLKSRGIGGTVKLKVLILANGTVKETQVVGGNAILADRAQKAVKQWIFAPAAAETTMEVTIVFDPNAENE
jgi:TonB family protein